eukprot:TRINITY_DN49363_c0_g1_i1.p1 TRINITY_DN49363_c0_g1~~TRINITY_DN49363_c0_g1_i1.p1  ORF type:complete len:572 (+),score=87.92 TRINITY_DN49363_c0_g1_i1:62-1777(+)
MQGSPRRCKYALVLALLLALAFHTALKGRGTPELSKLQLNFTRTGQSSPSSKKERTIDVDAQEVQNSSTKPQSAGQSQTMVQSSNAAPLPAEKSQVADLDLQADVHVEIQTVKPPPSGDLEELLKPGRCAADFIKPPCDPFKVAEYDLDKYEDQTLALPKIEDGYKLFTFGAADGKLYVAYGTQASRSSAPAASATARYMYLLSKHIPISTMFKARFNDVPWDINVVPIGNHGRRSASEKCTHLTKTATFHTVSDPRSCDISLPWGVRPGKILRMNDQIPFAEKRNQAFWGGSIWPCSGRTEGGMKNCPRYYMARASKKYPEVIKAFFTPPKESEKGRTKMPKEIDKYQLIGQKLPENEQLKYRFLMTSSPSVTYTGRLVNFLSTHSVVVKFGHGFEYAAQPLYGGLQDGVHLKLLHKPKSDDILWWVPTLQKMEANPDMLAQIADNARTYIGWVDSDFGALCYMLELLAGYSKKLKPGESSRTGAIFNKLKPSQSKVRVLRSWNDGTAHEFDDLKVSVYSYEKCCTVEVVELPKANGTAEALREKCRAFRASRPKEKVYHATSREWTTRE